MTRTCTAAFIGAEEQVRQAECKSGTRMEIAFALMVVHLLITVERLEKEPQEQPIILKNRETLLVEQ